MNLKFFISLIVSISCLISIDAAEIRDGLVCHLTFDGDALDHSASANENHGKIVGEPDYEPGKINPSIAIHGSEGQYVDLGQPADLQFGDLKTGCDFSVSMWVRIDGPETWPVLITNKDYSSKPAGNSTSHTGWGVFLHTDKKIRWNGKDDRNDALFIEHVGPALTDGTWHHVAVTHHRQGRAAAYVDGRLVGSVYMGTLTSTIDAGLPTVIGNDGLHSMGAWDGAVDDVGIWRRVLTPHEVWTVYSGGLAGKNLQECPPTSALVGSDVACRWVPNEPEPTLAITITNNSPAPWKPANWRITGKQAELVRLESAPEKVFEESVSPSRFAGGSDATAFGEGQSPLSGPDGPTLPKGKVNSKTRSEKTLQPGVSVEARLVFDRPDETQKEFEAALLFDHDASNTEQPFRIDLARQRGRMPYRYRFPGFEQRMGQPVPRDETGRIVVNDGYHDPAMVGDLLKAFAEQYPAITHLEQIGQTWQQRPLWTLRISAGGDKELDKPAFLFVGAHHGNELLSTEFVLDIVQYLTTNRDKDPRVRAWLSTYEIWCLPLANPDGCYRFFHVDSAGRKNGRDSNGNGRQDYADGVDINRNYPFRWHSLGETGSKSDPEAGWYRGPAPASEPEVRAIMNFADRERFVGLISYHTAGTRILVPYTIDNCRSPRPNTAWVLAGHLAGLSDSGREDREYLPVKNLYSVDGTDQDWHFWRHGTMAFLCEGPRTSPPINDRDRYVIGVRPGWQFLLERLAAGPSLSGHVRDAATGAPLEAVVSLDEIEMFEGEVHTSHPVTGRFDRYLPQAGTYHVRVCKDGYETQVMKVEVGREWKQLQVDMQRVR